MTITLRIEGADADTHTYTVSGFGFLPGTSAEPDWVGTVDEASLRTLVGARTRLVVGQRYVCRPQQAAQAAVSAGSSSASSPRNPPLWCAHSRA